MTIQLFNGEGYRTFPIPESKFSILKFFQKKNFETTKCDIFWHNTRQPCFQPCLRPFLTAVKNNVHQKKNGSIRAKFGGVKIRSSFRKNIFRECQNKPKFALFCAKNTKSVYKSKKKRAIF